MMTTAISTTDLLNWIPHRSPMLWVDEVLSFSSEGGECLVRLKPDAHYMTDGKLRATSLVEFMAQAYGFILICNVRSQDPDAVAFRDTFLVAVTDAHFEDLKLFPEIYSEPILYVRIGRPRSLGSIYVFSGSVWTAQNRCIGKAQIKVFAN